MAIARRAHDAGAHPRGEGGAVPPGARDGRGVAGPGGSSKGEVGRAFMSSLLRPSLWVDALSIPVHCPYWLAGWLAGCLVGLEQCPRARNQWLGIHRTLPDGGVLRRSHIPAHPPSPKRFSSDNVRGVSSTLTRLEKREVQKRDGDKMFPPADAPGLASGRDGNLEEEEEDEEDEEEENGLWPPLGSSRESSSLGDLLSQLEVRLLVDGKD